MKNNTNEAFYSNFSINEAKDIGRKFKVICHANYSYEGKLTNGKEYEITIEPRILSLSPICSFTCDNGKLGEAHLIRFTKVE